MVDIMKEKISALVDGDVAQDEMQGLIRELRKDPKQRDCWEHYHLIGDAMRNNLPDRMDRSFVNRISEAIAQEDLPIRVPQPDASAAFDHKREKSVIGIAKPAAGFAVAASVAMVAYLGFGVVAVDEQLSGNRMADNGLSSQNHIVIARQQPAQGLQLAREAVSGSAQGAMPGLTKNGIRWDVARPAVENRLNTYLYNHQSHSNQAQINTRMMPNARIVIHTPKAQ